MTRQRRQRPTPPIPDHQRIDLNSAKALSRRLGLTYKEIVEIVKTGFVNPKLAKLALLYKLGVSIQDARFYLDHKNDSATATAEEQKRHLEVQAFTQKLDTLADTFHTTADYLEGQLQAIPFESILVLADPERGLRFRSDHTAVRRRHGSRCHVLLAHQPVRAPVAQAGLDALRKPTAPCAPSCRRTLPRCSSPEPATAEDRA